MAISSKPQIEVIQSVTAYKVTDPRLTRQVEPGPVGFQRSYNTVLYYKGVEGHARVFVGHIKESLGQVFGENPFFCGRIRRTDGGFELFSNDSGARLIQAKIGVGLETYLESEGRDKDEAELVHWKDIDEEEPQFSPLLYIQVTYFECSGFSVGISCSLLLADPLAFSNFLKRLETIHANLFAQENTILGASLSSLFDLHSPIKYPPSPYGIKPSPKTSNMDLFRLEGSAPRSDYGPLALLCVKETESETEFRMRGELCMLVNDGNGVTEVESVAKSGLVESHIGKGQLKRVSWDEFGASKVMFRFQAVKEVPVSVSHWIESPDGFVMVVASGSSEDDVVYVFVVYVL